MSEPIGLISSCIISQYELSKFIVSANGQIISKKGLFGRISRGECHIWIGLAEEELEVIYGDHDLLFIERLSSLIKGAPQTYVSVDISRKKGSERIALEFAIKFTERWASVVDDLHGNLLTYDDLLLLYRDARGIRAVASI